MSIFNFRPMYLCFWAALLITSPACNSTTGTPLGDGATAADGHHSGDGSTTNGDGSSSSDAKTGVGDGGQPTTDAWSGNNQPSCNGVVYACSDGKDNDADGKIDSNDAECVGPCDNDEKSFATGISGDNVDSCKQDCFFDGNSGQGEKCEWNLKCDPKSPGANLKPKACPFDAEFNNCPGPQTEQCRNNCLGFVPNGCDCFGCCSVFINGVAKLIYLGSGSECSTSNPSACASCTQVASCLNPCDDCELCLGKTIKDLPSKCLPKQPDGGTPSDAGTPTQPTPQCPVGKTPCLNNGQCASGYYCITGCCTKVSLE